VAFCAKEKCHTHLSEGLWCPGGIVLGQGEEVINVVGTELTGKRGNGGTEGLGAGCAVLHKQLPKIARGREERKRGGNSHSGWKYMHSK